MKYYHMRTRIFVAYLLFMLCFAAFSIIYWCVQLYLQQNIDDAQQVSLLAQHGSSVVDSIMAGVSNVLYMHNDNPTLKSVLLKEPPASESNYPEDKTAVFSVEKAVMQQNSIIKGIVYIGKSGKLYSSIPEDVYPNEEPAVLRASQGHGVPCMGDLQTMIWNGSYYSVLPISKQLIDISTGESMGFIIIYLDFYDICAQIEYDTGISKGFYTLILNQQNVIYSSNISDRLFDSAKVKIGLWNSLIPPDQAKFDYHDPQMLVSGLRNQRTNWIIVKYSAVKWNPSGTWREILIYFLISLMCLALLLFVGYYSIKRISKNIYTFHDALYSVQGPKLKKIDETHLRNDEIADLIHEFNHMTSELNESIQKEYMAKIQAQDMQIRMLNYQINPHFLYNCLNLISSIASLKNVPEISKITKILGDMFHYSIGNSDFVTINEELKHLENYLYIQSVRFGDSFRIVYDIDSDTGLVPCMKFILQPLVENCFKHGFSGKHDDRRKNTVEISIKREGSDILIRIYDNGSGISTETLNTIYENLYDDSEQIVSNTTSIGLWNINKRIKTYYGPAYGLEVSSALHEYTCVHVKFPVIGDAGYEHHIGG